jgi:hypothetical protein
MCMTIREMPLQERTALHYRAGCFKNVIKSNITTRLSEDVSVVLSLHSRLRADETCNKRASEVKKLLLWYQRDEKSRYNFLMVTSDVNLTSSLQSPGYTSLIRLLKFVVAFLAHRMCHNGCTTMTRSSGIRQWHWPRRSVSVVLFASGVNCQNLVMRG